MQLHFVPQNAVKPWIDIHEHLREREALVEQAVAVPGARKAQVSLRR